MGILFPARPNFPGPTAFLVDRFPPARLVAVRRVGMKGRNASISVGAGAMGGVAWAFASSAPYALALAFHSGTLENVPPRAPPRYLGRFLAPFFGRFQIHLISRSTPKMFAEGKRRTPESPWLHEDQRRQLVGRAS